MSKRSRSSQSVIRVRLQISGSVHGSSAPLPEASVPAEYVTAPRRRRLAPTSTPNIAIAGGARGTFAMGPLSVTTAVPGRPAMTPAQNKSPIGRYAGLAAAPLLSPMARGDGSGGGRSTSTLFSVTLKGFATSDLGRLEKRRDEVLDMLTEGGAAPLAAAGKSSGRASRHAPKATKKRHGGAADVKKAAAIAARKAVLPRQRLPVVTVKPRCPFATQFASKGDPKALWGNLLAEMKWWAADFRGERKRKRKTEKKYNRGVNAFHKQRKLKQQRELKERLKHRKQQARTISKSVLSFWGKVDQILMYKHRERLEVRKQQSMERRLRYLVKQTETLSSSIVTKMLDGRSARVGKSAAAHALANSAANARGTALVGRRVTMVVSDLGVGVPEILVSGVVCQKMRRRFAWEGDATGLGSMVVDESSTGGHRVRPRAADLEVKLDTGMVRPFPFQFVSSYRRLLLLHFLLLHTGASLLRGRIPWCRSLGRG